MAIEHISKFITDLAMHFSPPRFEHEHERSAWQKSIMRELHGATPEVIDRAARHIIQTRKNRYFPLIAECRQAVREAAEAVRFEGHLGTLPTLRKSLGDDWTKERQDLADQLVKCGLGKQAARDNPSWTLGLWHFCRKHQRIPTAPEEIEHCKREARLFWEGYQVALRGGWPQARGWVNYGDSMIADREKLCAEVLGR